MSHKTPMEGPHCFYQHNHETTEDKHTCRHAHKHICCAQSWIHAQLRTYKPMPLSTHQMYIYKHRSQHTITINQMFPNWGAYTLIFLWAWNYVFTFSLHGKLTLNTAHQQMCWESIIKSKLFQRSWRLFLLFLCQGQQDMLIPLKWHIFIYKNPFTFYTM